MTERIKELFACEKIEYAAVLKYSDCRILRQDIMAREPFLPQSVIIYLVPYYTGACENISAYAASEDYHIYIKELNAKIISGLKAAYPESSFAGYGDRSPIDERRAAASAGLGIRGKNGLLINEKYGSYVFIGEIITDVSPELLDAVPPSEIRGCIECGACAAACPTGILSGSGKECLSAITQKKGELTAEEEELMRRVGTVWGCDECQRACPYNKSAKPTPVPFFYRNRITRLTSDILSSMTDTEFERRAFSWRKRKTVERNLKAFEKRE